MIYRLTALLLILCSLPALAQKAYTEIAARAGAENITGNGAAWRYQEVNWKYRATDGAAYYATAGHDERFELQDSSLRGGLHIPASKRWAFDAELAISPEHHFLPKDSLFAGFDYTVARGWILHAGIRHSRYDNSQANVATAGLETYIGPWRLAYTLFEGTSGGASGASNLVQADWYYGNHSFVGLGLVHGREVERIDPTRLVVTPINGISLNGEHALSARWAITYTLGITSLQDFYTRRGVSIGVAYRY